jgi:O-antigen/teichoic acid export membrane protein
MLAEKLSTAILRILPSGRFARGAAILVSGTAAGQILIILSSPIITRLYSPEEFGVFAVYAALLALLILVANFRYEWAIPLPKPDVGGAALLLLCLILVVLTGAVTAVIVGLLGDKLVNWLNVSVVEPYLWALPVGVAIGGAYNALSYWALRNKSFGRLAGSRLGHSSGMVLSQLALGYFHAGALGLIVGHLVGFATGLASLLKVATSRHAALKEVSPRLMLENAVRYRNFPIFSSWGALANAAGVQLPLILFASLFSPTIAGLYMLAHRVASVPAAFLSEAIGKAFMAAAIVARRENNLPEVTIETFALLIRIGLAPVVILAVIAPELFAIVFGSAWEEAGHYLQWIALWIAIVFIFAPLSSLFAVLERQGMELIFQITLLIARVGALLVGASLGDPGTAVALFAVAATVVYLGFGAWLLRAAEVTHLKLGKVLLGELRFVVPLGLGLVVGKAYLRQLPFAPTDVALILVGVGIVLGIVCLIRVRVALRAMAQLGKAS